MRRLDGIYESALPPHKNTLWLDKGVAKYYRNGKWVSLGGDSSEDRQELEEKVDSLDKEMGDVKQAVTSMETYFSPVIFFNIGNSDEVKAQNLSNLSIVPTGTLFECEINYGFGVGRMLTDGGTAHVITPDGHLVKYSISTDGVVTKVSEVNLDDTYVLPAASAAELGGVKKSPAIADIVVDSATAESVAYKLNDILGALRSSGLISE